MKRQQDKTQSLLLIARRSTRTIIIKRYLRSWEYRVAILRFTTTVAHTEPPCESLPPECTGSKKAPNTKRQSTKATLLVLSPEHFLFWNCFHPRSKQAIIQSGRTFGVTWYADCFGLSGTPAISESR